MDIFSSGSIFDTLLSPYQSDELSSEVNNLNLTFPNEQNIYEESFYQNMQNDDFFGDRRHTAMHFSSSDDMSSTMIRRDSVDPTHVLFDNDFAALVNESDTLNLQGTASSSNTTDNNLNGSSGDMCDVDMERDDMSPTMLQLTPSPASESSSHSLVNVKSEAKSIFHLMSENSNCSSEFNSSTEDSPKSQNKKSRRSIAKHKQFGKPGEPLILSEEERKLLDKESLVLPAYYPLTQSQERLLKRIRRKIRNKLSAMESRRKKKAYVDRLEEKLQLVCDENSLLRDRLKNVEKANNLLKKELDKPDDNNDVEVKQEAKDVDLSSFAEGSNGIPLRMCTGKALSGASLPDLKDAKVLAALPLRRSQRDRNNVKSTYLLALVLSVMLVVPTGPQTKISQEIMKSEMENKINAQVNSQGVVGNDAYLGGHKSRVLGSATDMGDPGGIGMISKFANTMPHSMNSTAEGYNRSRVLIENDSDGMLLRHGYLIEEEVLSPDVHTEYKVPVIKALR